MADKKVLPISGIIGWEVEASDVRSFLDDLNGEDLEVQISSPGGYVYPGLEIYNLLRSYKGHVTTRLMGLAASMASYIAMVGDYVIAEDNAIFMIHNASGFAMGDHNTMKKAAGVIEGISNLLAKKYMEKTGLSLAEVKLLMDEETFLFGDEIKDSGFVDEIAETDSSKDKATAVALAKADITACNAKMKTAESEHEDLEKAAALLDPKVLNLKSQGGGSVETNWNYRVCKECGYWEAHNLGDSYNCPTCGKLMQGVDKQPEGGVSMVTLKEIMAIENPEDRVTAIDDFFKEIFNSDREVMVKDVLKGVGTEAKVPEVPAVDDASVASGDSTTPEAPAIETQASVAGMVDLEAKVLSLQTKLDEAVATAETEHNARELMEVKESLRDSVGAGNLDKMAETLVALKKINPALAEEMRTHFQDTAARLKAAGVFSELGSAGEGVQKGAYEKLLAQVDTALEADSSITPAKAWKNVIRDNPELYKEYLKER